MFEALLASALGRWIKSHVVSLGVTGILLLLVLALSVVLFFKSKPDEDERTKLQKENTSLIAKNKELEAQVATLLQVNKSLSEQIENKEKSDKASDAITIDEENRKKVIDQSTTKSVDRIQGAFVKRAVITNGSGLKLKPDQNFTAGSVSVPENVYLSPSEVVMDELWSGYCGDMKGSSPQCQSPTTSNG